jgi:hypothetical protein
MCVTVSARWNERVTLFSSARRTAEREDAEQPGASDSRGRHLVVSHDEDDEHVIHDVFITL